MGFPKFMPPLRYNPINDGDSYKDSHPLLYKPGVERVYSFLESRGGEHDDIMFGGFQALAYQKLSQPIEQWHIEQAAEFNLLHFGTDALNPKKAWQRIRDEFDSKLPLKIKTIPEGLIVPKRTPVLTAENTADGLGWLVGNRESMILSDIFPFCSIASRVFRMKRRLKPVFGETSDNGISPFAVLDFSRRGCFGYNHAQIAGAAFCYMFQGSDNKPGIQYANYNYFHQMAAHSVIATEHSISCSYGVNADDDYIERCIDVVPEGSILSLVGDTWDIYKFANRLVTFKDKIINKKLTIVCRPDSGNRWDVLPQVLRILAQGFGTTKNNKGYDVINYGVKALWGDGMDENTITEPFEIAKAEGLSADCVMAGSGGGIAAKDLDRDTDRWAFKASEYVMQDGSRLAIAKNPITDPGKASKAGRFGIIRDDEGAFETIKRINDHEDERDIMEVRFLDGDVLNAQSLDQIRERVEAQL